MMKPEQLHIRAKELALEHLSCVDGQFRWKDRSHIDALWVDVGNESGLVPDETIAIRHLIREKVGEWHPKGVRVTQEVLQAKAEFREATSTEFNGKAIELKEGNLGLFLALHDGVWDAWRIIRSKWEEENEEQRAPIALPLKEIPDYGDHVESVTRNLHNLAVAGHYTVAAKVDLRVAKMLTGAEEDLDASARLWSKMKRFSK